MAKKTVYGKNVVQTPRVSNLPAFRFPDAEIQGLDTSGDTSQTDENVDFTCLPENPPPQVDIGVPTDVRIEGQPRIVKKGTTSFVDVDISFIPVEGAVRHQFRIAKFASDPEEEEE
jgi:hypothetical protein